jgi:hypothetical protein
MTTWLIIGGIWLAVIVAGLVSWRRLMRDVPRFPPEDRR